MAAITFATLTGGRQYRRAATAQATTGQTDWFMVPEWAKYMTIDYDLTAVAGNTPLVDVTIKQLANATLDDTTGVVNLQNHAALTQLTAAARLLVQVGPGITGIADDVTNAATGLSNVSINAVLPPYIGVKVLNDRTSGDETYTYTLTVTFHKG
jgi:hypothetical protein